MSYRNSREMPIDSQEASRVSAWGLAVAAAIALLAGFVYHRATTGHSASATLAELKRSGTIRVGFANEAPFGYLDTATGEVTGEAPEIARHILSRMGITEIVPVVTEFGSLIPGLQARRFDIIAAGMYITPPRCREILFSDPTYAIGETFLVRRDRRDGLDSFEAVAAQAEVRLGVMGGSVEHGYAKSLGVAPSQIVVFPDYASGLAGLQSGRVDAMAVTTLTAADLLAKLGDPSIVQVEDFRDPVIDGHSVRGYGAFGFRKEDQALRDAFNELLVPFLGTPEHQSLVRPFGFTEAMLPQGVTAEQLCGGVD